MGSDDPLLRSRSAYGICFLTWRAFVGKCFRTLSNSLFPTGLKDVIGPYFHPTRSINVTMACVFKCIICCSIPSMIEGTSSPRHLNLSTTPLQLQVAHKRREICLTFMGDPLQSIRQGLSHCEHWTYVPPKLWLKWCYVINNEADIEPWILNTQVFLQRW